MCDMIVCFTAHYDNLGNKTDGKVFSSSIYVFENTAKTLRKHQLIYL